MPPRSAYATAGRFDLLNAEGDDDTHTASDSEEEVEVVQQKQKNDQAEVKKVVESESVGAGGEKGRGKGKKSKALANKSELSASLPASMTEAAQAVTTKAEEVLESTKSTINGLAPSLGAPLTNGNGKDHIPSSSEEKEEKEDARIEEVAEKSEEIVAIDGEGGEDSSVPKDEEIEGASAPATPTPKSRKNKKKSATTNTTNSAFPQTSFSPSLPDTLPNRPTTPTPTDLLNSNRKRPYPSEFTLDPDATSTPPPSKGVKFEDGLSPGQGKEGEVIIPGVGRYTAEERERESVKERERVAVAQGKKKSDVVQRTVWTLVMIGGFIGLLCAGPVYMILLVFLIQCVVYKEVTALFELSVKSESPAGKQANLEERGGDQWSKTLNWYFFVVANYFLYGESIIYYFKHIIFIDAIFLPFASNHRFISFMLYVFGFMAFVMNLQKQYLRIQFALFCWVHMTLFTIVLSSHFIVNNILEGLIWFWVPASLVICNDIFAYVCGRTFGRTSLFKLSPKKTVEGFVGAFFCTLIFAVAWGSFFMRFNYMICPAQDLGMNILSNVQCEPNPVFVWHKGEWPGAIQALVSSITGGKLPAVPYVPYQVHLLIMATFASLVAPFGGFFASGFKRAFDIKDFGDSIPGHGGATDRMDCQFIMGIFSYVYYSSVIRIHHVTVGSVLQTIVSSLSTQEQLEVYMDLQKYLTGQGIKP